MRFDRNPPRSSPLLSPDLDRVRRLFRKRLRTGVAQGAVGDRRIGYRRPPAPLKEGDEVL